jgi:cytochrome b561
MIKDTENSYSLISRLFHWFIGISIISLLIAGYYMTDLPPSDQKYQIYGIHKAFGFIVLILTIARIFWRILNIAPKTIQGTPHWQEVASKVNFKLLYSLSLIMPLSGIFMSLYGGFPISVFGIFTIEAFEKNQRLASLAREFHGAFAIVLICSLSLHVVGALYHHFIKKDRTLKRMIVG